MAEKPRLKDSDEILSSIGKQSKKTLPLVESEPPPKEENLISSPLNKPVRSKRKQAAAPEGEERSDPRPLDFGKYALPGQKRKQQKQPAVPAAEAGKVQAVPQQPEPVLQPQPVQQEPQPQPTEKPKTKRAAGTKRQAAKAAQAQQAAAKEAAALAAPARAKVLVEEAPLQQEAAKVPLRREAGPTAAHGSGAPVAQAQEEPVIREYQYEDFGAPEKEREAPPPAKEVKEYAFPTLEPSNTREAAPGKSTEKAEGLLPEEKNQRANFLKRLSSQFEQEFSQRFKERPAEKKLGGEPSWFDAPPQKRNEQPPLLPQEEIEANKEAERFLRQFEESVKAEEERKAESFKETLAEKFERERQRYLEELGIGQELETPPEEAAPRRKRLDLKIQPEMHRQADEKEPLPPMTYGPGGRAKIQEDSGEALPYVPSGGAAGQEQHFAASAREEAPIEPHSGKKTPEELLLELGASKALRAFAEKPPAQSPPKTLRQPLRLDFAPVPEGEADGERAKKKPKSPAAKKLRKKTMAVSAAAALVALALLAWPITTWLRYSAVPEAQAEEPAALTIPQDTITFYESRSYEKPTSFSNAMVKKANISLSNIQVAENLVVLDIETQGDLLLKDMSVGGAIHIKACAVDLLRLENVQASRIVISNPNARVTVLASGATTVGAVEVRTPATLRQQAIAEDFAGIEHVIMKKSEDVVSAFDVALEGLELQSLSAMEDSVISLKDSTHIEAVSSKGNLVLGGDGSVLSISAGAEDLEREISIVIKDVAVSKLDLQNPAQLNLASRVDQLTTASGLKLSGGGVVGSLMLNSGSSALRTPLDITDMSVHNLVANTNAKVNALGTTQVNSVTANHSVYMLGNKVNYLDVKANDVIYEKEPDTIRTAAGVHPPQSVADNPNLNYDLPQIEEERPLDTTQDPFASTCTHARELGAFVVGDGSLQNPFQVSTPAQLAHVGNHLSSHFVQTKDIDISDDGSFASGFPGIGPGGTFTGSYDGGGYSISNLRISGEGEQVALFAKNTGVIRNVNIKSGEIRSASGRTYTGGIVGLNFEGGVVEACSNGAKVSGASGYAGGIAGYNSGAKIRDCYNYAKVTGTGHVGGIAGMNWEKASIVGSYNAGTIEGGAQQGAVAGMNSGATIANCYYLADTAEAGIGTGPGNVVVKTSDELSAGQMAADLAAGDEDSPWVMPSTGSYTYPVLKAPGGSGGSLPESSPLPPKSPDLPPANPDLPPEPEEEIPLIIEE